MGETRNQALRAARPEDGVGYIFGAICPAEGKGAGLVLPPATARLWPCISRKSRLQSRQEHMRSFFSIRQDGLEEAAGSGNITLIPLPPKSPELNPVENIWQFMRDNWLSNRVFKSYDDILDHCCFAWNKLIDMPGR